MCSACPFAEDFEQHNVLIFYHLRLVFYYFLRHLWAILGGSVASINQQRASCFQRSRKSIVKFDPRFGNVGHVHSSLLNEVQSHSSSHNNIGFTLQVSLYTIRPEECFLLFEKKSCSGTSITKTLLFVSLLRNIMGINIIIKKETCHFVS